MGASRDTRNGHWRYRKRVKLPDGRTTRITGTPATNTKRAAEAAERDHILRLTNPAAVATPREKEVPTVREYAPTWLTAHAVDKPSEIATKKQILKAYVLPRFGESGLAEIGQSDLDGFRAELLATRSRKSVNNIMSVVSSLLRYAAANGLIEVRGLSFFMKGNDTELVAVAADDVDRLVDAAGDARYRAAILLAADAGLRIGEVRGLRWSDLDEIHKAITVARSIDPRNNVTATKNRHRREVPASSRLWRALQDLGELGETLITTAAGSPLGYYAAREKLLEIYNRAGVALPPKPWHCLRHTFCSELARSGTAINVIRDLAGHESIETTLRYMHTDREAKRSAIDGLAETGQQVGNGRKPKRKKPRNRL